MADRPLVVWKYPVPIEGDGRVIVSVPRGARWLSVRAQRGEFMVWALVDPAAAREQRQLAWVGTGFPDVDPRHGYIGTIVTASDQFVFHLFDTGPLGAKSGAGG